MFIDIHAHLSNAINTELIILNASENKDESQRALNIYNENKNILPCVGFHPNKVKENTEENLNYIKENVDKFFAISEVGLDFKNKSPEEVKLQENVLSKILEIAEKSSKVLIVHNRKSIKRFLEIRSSYKVKVIYHNYEGNISLLPKVYSFGDAISISTAFLKFKYDSLLKRLDFNHLFFETDSPALSPFSYPNVPENVKLIYDYFAKIRGISINDLEKIVENNFKNYFNTK